MSLFLFSLAAYLLCSIPFGKLLSRKVADIDITRKGSGNVGATNVARIIGFKWGMLTLLLDALKGFIPVYLFRSFSSGFEIDIAVVVMASLLGHQFSIFQRFRGGKGVATALGIYVAILPGYILIVILFFILTVYVSGYVSLGSILSASLMPFLLLLSDEPKLSVITASVMAALIWIKHRENIERLFRGQERGWRKAFKRSADQEDGPVPRRNKNK
jgi:glycerol-3-phosphate acyltransferase PlsY